MKRKRGKKMKFTDPEYYNPRILVVRLDGGDENQLDYFHANEVEEKKEEDENEDSSFVMTGDYPCVDLGLQIVLLESTQLCSSSTTTNQDSFKKIPRDEKMKGIWTDSLNPYRTSCSWTFSVQERGEPSCGYCVICDDVKPIRSIIRSECGHYCCEDCIRIYLGEKIQENILSVKCPEKDCKVLLNAKFWSLYVPEEVFDRWKMACVEGSILVSPQMIVCPFCFREFVDDRRRFLIRACTRCWKIFCMICRVRWHMGMSCEQFQLREEMTFLNSMSCMVSIEDLISSMITNLGKNCISR